MKVSSNKVKINVQIKLFKTNVQNIKDATYEWYLISTELRHLRYGVKLKRRLIDSMAHRSFDSHRRRTSFNVARRVKRWKQWDKKEKKRWNHATSVDAGSDKNEISFPSFCEDSTIYYSSSSIEKPAPAKRQMKNEICSWSCLANPEPACLFRFLLSERSRRPVVG